MELRRTRDRLPRVEWRERSPSTNAELRSLWDAEPDLPHGTLLATADQPAGRGRAGRSWATAPGAGLAASMLLRGEWPATFGPQWVPLLAGTAYAAALQPRFDDGLRVGVKWPNDVHVRDEDDAQAGRPGKKLCGILCELLPDQGAGSAIIVGVGTNVLTPEWELPTPRAASLLSAGAELRGFGGVDPEDDAPLSLTSDTGRLLADDLLCDTSDALLRAVAHARSDPRSARIRVLRSSLTLGTEVRVHLPGDEIVDGFARTLDESGALVVDLPTGGVLTVSAGDVEHLR